MTYKDVINHFRFLITSENRLYAPDFTEYFENVSGTYTTIHYGFNDKMPYLALGNFLPDDFELPSPMLAEGQSYERIEVPTKRENIHLSIVKSKHYNPYVVVWHFRPAYYICMSFDDFKKAFIHAKKD